jgi:hypothetical protein
MCSIYNTREWVHDVLFIIDENDNNSIDSKQLRQEL